MPRENKFGVLANLILSMFMASCMIQTLYTSFFMTTRLSLTVFIAVVPLTLLFYVMFRSRLSTLFSLIAIAAFTTVGLSLILFKIGIASVNAWIRDYAVWFIDMSNGYSDLSNPVFTYLTILGLCIVMTFAVYLFTIRFYNFYVICVLLFGIFFTQLQFNILSGSLCFVLSAFAFLLYYFFHILRRRSKDKNYEVRNRAVYLVSILPVCALGIGISLLFPVFPNRVAIPWLDTKIDNGIKKAVNYFSNANVSGFDYFSFGSSGFGNDDILGGNIKLSKINVMNVKTDNPNLYLRGSSKAFYDGHRWYDDNDSYQSLGVLRKEFDVQVSNDSNEFLLGNILLNGRSRFSDELFKTSSAEVEFLNIKTKSLFIPLKLNKLTFTSPQDIRFDNEQMLSMRAAKEKGFKYSFEYNNLYLGSDVLQNTLRKSYKGYFQDHVVSLLRAMGFSFTRIDEGKRDNNGSPYITNDTESRIVDSYNSNLNMIYSKYTQLPEGITPRVRQLAQDLTGNEGNVYDKTKAVENYLSSNYPYTLKPGTPPRRMDFVDYFLFEGKQGYCTYYASAMTVLLRCVGIPARYVEGYIMPPDSKNGVFQVTNQQAHAWVEVYFDSFGWIPFEPTAPFVANLYNDRTISATVSGNMTNSAYDDYLDMMNRYRDPGAQINVAPEDSGSVDTSESNTPLVVLIIAASVVGLVLLVFLILASINMLKFYKTLRKIRKADPNDSILHGYDYILKALRFNGVTINAGETPTQFGDRIERTFDFRTYSYNKSSFTRVTDHYVRARYSMNPLTSRERQDILDFIDILLGLILEKKGKFKFGVSRYIFGRI